MMRPIIITMFNNKGESFCKLGDLEDINRVLFIINHMYILSRVYDKTANLGIQSSCRTYTRILMFFSMGKDWSHLEKIMRSRLEKYKKEFFVPEWEKESILNPTAAAVWYPSIKKSSDMPIIRFGTHKPTYDLGIIGSTQHKDMYQSALNFGVDIFSDTGLNNQN